MAKNDIVDGATYYNEKYDISGVAQLTAEQKKFGVEKGDTFRIIYDGPKKTKEARNFTAADVVLVEGD